jgi:UDP-2,3-diacylglucosamine hydrolase
MSIPFQQWLSELSAPLEVVAVSDVHLRQADDERARLLMDLVQQLQNFGKLGHFAFIGDIFDFCLGSRIYFRRKFANLGASVSKLADNGTRVVFQEGNHEFDMQRMDWGAVEFFSTNQVELDLPSGLLTITHGDLVHCSEAYRKFRTTIKSGLIRGVARQIPGFVMDWYALNHASVSRGADQYRKLNHAALLQDFEDWQNNSRSKHIMFGHFHMPYHWTSQKLGTTFSSMTAWDKPNFLAIVNGRYYRGEFDRRMKQWLMRELSEEFRGTVRS